MNPFTVLAFYFLSFLPLWASVLFVETKSLLATETAHGAEWAMVLFLLVGFAAALIFVRRDMARLAAAGKTELLTVKRVEDLRTVTTEYLLAYVLPLFAFDFTKWDGVVLFAIFFATFGFLAIRHQFLSANVALEMMGFRFCKCLLSDEHGHERETVVMTRNGAFREALNETIPLPKMNDQMRLDVSSLRMK